jgi:ABC-2 type transport system ATP-binding protein
MPDKKGNISIQTFSLSKKFGEFTVINDINLTIRNGEIYCLIGPNGAGKTTLLKSMVGLYKPNSGRAEIKGVDIQKDPVAAKSNFGYVSDDPFAYTFLTGFEFLALTGNLRGMDKNVIKVRIKEISTIFPIKEILGQKISGFSRGSRQKLAFLSAIIDSPPVLFIDEPIAGLDPESMEIFGNTIKKYVENGNTVFYISHSLPFAEKYAQKVGIMKKGKIIKETEAKHLHTVTHLMDSK